ncbi:hypothetical protein FRC06_005884 [Ceratobasidium sp. 370]|nr:hypothetical protein FRC06_005884 [Ceratobasidium sp. 370]
MSSNAVNASSTFGASSRRSPTPEPILDWMMKEYNEQLMEQGSWSASPRPREWPRHDPWTGAYFGDERCNPEFAPPAPRLEPTDFNRLLMAGNGWSQPNGDRYLYTTGDEEVYRDPFRIVLTPEHRSPQEEHRPLPQIFDGTDSESDSSEDSAELLVTEEVIERSQRLIEDQQRMIETMREVNRRARAIVELWGSGSD